MTRSNRQLKILEIISKRDIDTQEELVEQLKRDGFNVTQATISRDIKDMGIIKTLTSDGRHYKYAVQHTKETNASDKYLNMFKNTVISIRSSQNLIVLKTEVGSAGPAAELIDKLNYTEVLGVIAGDNTIFVAIDSVENTAVVQGRLEALLDSAR